MAQYAPQANALSDEQEYLQAYEDVLEKYKGRSDRLMSGGFGIMKIWCDYCLTVQ